MAENKTDRVSALLAILEPLAAENGLDIDNLTFNNAGKKSVIRIFIDAEERPDLDACVDFGRLCGEALDLAEEKGEIRLPEAYNLEVGTPGVDRPLVKPRHFRQNRGRLISHEGKKYRIGAMDEAEENIIAVEIAKKSAKLDKLSLAELAGAVVEVEFKEAPAEQRALVELDFAEAEAQITAE
ncbi:MAG: ribosome maturation factor RimP [Corynebacterium sp.]|nr:ribosome maturation factor RimP [Corynebacterium sp.]